MLLEKLWVIVAAGQEVLNLEVELLLENYFLLSVLDLPLQSQDMASPGEMVTVTPVVIYQYDVYHYRYDN